MDTSQFEYLKGNFNVVVVGVLTVLWNFFFLSFFKILFIGFSQLA